MSISPMTIRIVRNALTPKPFAVEQAEWDEVLRRIFAAVEQPSEPGVDVAALNRELCEKEGHVLGVVARPCLRCHKWFDPQYGRNMPRDGLTLFALSVLTNLSSATPATHPDTYRVAQGYADAWLARSPETKGAKQAAICPNCDAELPKGCGGVFKSEGESCALNWPTENRTLP